MKDSKYTPKIYTRDVAAGDCHLDEAAQLIAELDASDKVKLDIAPQSFYSEIAQKEQSVLAKYKALLADLTKEEELEVLGISLKQAFPPIERDVEKLVIDLNIIVYHYMQMKMEQDNDVRVETVRSTVQTALRKISAALLTMMAEVK